MGACFSCLDGSKADTIDEENASLLSNDKARLVEDELMIELRNKQLNAILNSTHDHLIDISNFKMLSTYGSVDNSNINGHANPDENETEEAEDDDVEDVFKISQVSKSVIETEISEQLSHWNKTMGKQTVENALRIKAPTTHVKDLVDLE